MVDNATFEQLVPVAYRWTSEQEEFVLAHGIPLSEKHRQDAKFAGIRDCDRVRVLVVDRIPLPNDPALAEAARRIGILTLETKCVGFGHAIIVRADCWGDRELLLHNFVHIAQCERSGGLEQWIAEYLSDRRDCPEFTIGALEEEARSLAREICAGHAAAV